MEAVLKEQLSIDKTHWTPVKFGDVVFEPKENAKDIYNEGIEHVVGLEHIDSENIHLIRSGVLEETTTFSKKFAIGDVLFGRRRAYLKKAALATFEGICSGDITVFRAKKNLLPELLPFIVNNEKFFDYAVKHSAGGLSPRVKFKDLANYEFLLPPKDQQAQLVELLWAMDEVIESETKLWDKIEQIGRIILSDLFYNQKRIKSIPLNEFYKKKFKSVNPVDFNNQKVQHYSLPSYLENKAPEITTANEIKSNKLLIDKDVVLFSKLNPNKPKIWKVKSSQEELLFGSTEWLPVLPSERMSLEYIEAYLSSQIFLDKVMKYVQGTSNSHKRVDPKRFYELELPILNESGITKVENFHSKYRRSLDIVESKIASSKALQKSLINQIF